MNEQKPAVTHRPDNNAACPADPAALDRLGALARELGVDREQLAQAVALIGDDLEAVRAFLAAGGPGGASAGIERRQWESYART